MAAQARLTPRAAALAKALAELLPEDGEPTVEALCDVLLEGLEAATARRKEARAREAEQEKEAHRAKQREIQATCLRWADDSCPYYLRGDDPLEQCVAWCAATEPWRPQSTRIATPDIIVTRR